MTDQRQNLLHLLHDAYVLARDIERLLRQFRDRHASHAGPASVLEARLRETRERQRLIGDCIVRIEGGIPVRRFKDGDSAGRQPTEPAQTESNVDHDLACLRTAISRESDVYVSAIAAAESGGFFETRLVCEANLRQTYPMAAWLSERVSS